MYCEKQFMIRRSPLPAAGNQACGWCGWFHGKEWVGRGEEQQAGDQRGMRFWNMKTDLGLVFVPMKGIWATGSQSRLRMHWMMLFGS